MAKCEKAVARGRFIRNHNVTLLLSMLLKNSLTMRSAALPDLKLDLNKRFNHGILLVMTIGNKAMFVFVITW